MESRKRLAAIVVGNLMLIAGAKNLQAASIYIPNASFESPQTSFVSVNIDSWQNAPTPQWYDESGGYFWSQLTGVFLNVPPEDEAHIDNCDGNQAAWLFAVPEVELYQDLTATFKVGQSYRLTVGIFGGGGNMKDDVPIEIRLYYRDADPPPPHSCLRLPLRLPTQVGAAGQEDAGGDAGAGNDKVTVGTTTYTYDWDTGYAKHFNDVHLDIPQVKGTDPWAGKNIGIQLISTLTLADLDPVTGRAGGFWDLDNVRLTKSLPGPDFTGDSFVNLEDFAVMTQEWLSCTETATDLTGDGCVNMKDLLVLVESWLGSIYGPDFTGDSFVNLEDVAVMAQEWLSCTETTTDLTGDGCVNMQDLMILGQSWLESI